MNTHPGRKQPFTAVKYTPQASYYIPILIALYQNGGELSVQQTYSSVKNMMNGLLLGDYEISKVGKNPRYQDYIKWMVHSLVRQGYVTSKRSMHTNWSLTGQGFKLANALVLSRVPEVLGLNIQYYDTINNVNNKGYHNA